MFGKLVFALGLLAASLNVSSAESVLQAAQRQEALAAAKEQELVRGANPIPVPVAKPLRSESDDVIIGIGGYGKNLRAEIFFRGVTTPVRIGDVLGNGWRVHTITPNKVTLALYDKKGKVSKTRDLNFVGYAPIPTEVRSPIPQGGPEYVPAVVPSR